MPNNGPDQASPLKATNPVLKIAVPSPLRRVFDYLMPDIPAATTPVPGMRVKVPFGNKQVVGIITALSHRPSDIAPERLKPVTEILDQQACLDTTLLSLYLWASDYYQFPVGQALQACLPKAVRQGQALTSKKKASSNHAITVASEQQQPLTLNPEQHEALSSIQASLNSFKSLLLEGVTGSGKTEVYLQAIAMVLQQRRQALLLIPEIGLTPQTLGRFQHRFPDSTIVTLHSNMTDSSRFKAWLAARNGEADIVIGTRSAIFTPLQKLGLIIVDEEHDSSYKQQEGFKYSARDLAVYRAHLQQVPVLLGSATPSLESLHNALTGRYQHLLLKQRSGSASMPPMTLLDLRGEPLQEGFSTPLLDEIQQHLAAGNQVLIFINRRGFAPTLLCHDCGWVAECKRCNSAYTLHQHPPCLRCHHCEGQKPLPGACPACHGNALHGLGLGTERSEQFLQSRFPGLPIIRVDRDSTRQKHAMDTIMQKVSQAEPCILIGTQMLAKGHHFPDVTLVAVLDADAGLFSPDFRGQENMGQLLTQVAGRAGRGDKPGKVLIQTHHCEHPALKRLMTEGYGSFARLLLAERQIAGTPPFGHLALIRAEASRREHPQAFLSALRKTGQALRHEGIKMLGPMPSAMEKRAGRYRYQVQVEAGRRQAMQRFLQALVNEMESHPLSRKVRWSVDVDPQESV
jgi:primosomal protein N' (replication factor Y) (superfamily II helicase)